METSLSKNFRIVLAITLKDITDAVKNKNIISLLLSALFVVVVYKYLPGLTAEEGPPALLVYDPDESALLAALEDSQAVDLYTYKSAADMQYYLTNGDQPELGLVIPSDFNNLMTSNKPLELQGYVLHLFTDDEVYSLKRFMEDEFENLLGQPITIRVERIQLQPETYGMTVITSMGFVFVTLMVGMLVIPHMMIEEKQEKTMDSLLISPATSNHIVVAKSLTGLIFTLIMLLMTLVFNWALIQQRWLFLLGGILGALFAIGLGILLGLVIDSRQQLTLWAWVVILPLYLPMMLVLMDNLFPERLIKILSWFPSSALFRVFRTAMAGTTPAAYFLPQLGILASCTLVFFIIDSWLIRRLDR